MKDCKCKWYTKQERSDGIFFSEHCRKESPISHPVRCRWDERTNNSWVLEVSVMNHVHIMTEEIL